MDFSQIASGQHGNPMAAAGIQALTNAFSGQGGGNNPYLAQALRQRQQGAPGQPPAGPEAPSVPGAPGAPMMQQQGPQGAPDMQGMPQPQQMPGQPPMQGQGPGQGQPDPMVMQQLMQLMAQGGMGG